MRSNKPSSHTDRDVKHRKFIKRITFEIEKDKYTQLWEFAVKNDLSMKQLIHDALDNYIKTF